MDEKKVALVTGATRGIGEAIATKFAMNGYNLIINYVGTDFDMDALTKKFNELGSDVFFIGADVSKYSDCERAVEEGIKKFGRIDVLVNNAGITKDGLLARMSEEDFDKVIAVNLKGTFNMSKIVSTLMMKRKSGRIVNIASVVGVSGNAGQCNYAASKAGIIGFTKSLAKELGSRNVLANCVAPGFIDTRMTAVLSDTVKENINSQIPMKRMGTPDEIANAVYFLGSDENTYITGQVLNIDGGMVM